MPRRQMNPPPSYTFDQVYEAIRDLPDQKITGLATTGGVSFDCEACIARDGRRYLKLPHGNRIYRGDWGFTTNSMGKDGQRIGHYARPLDEWCAARLNRDQTSVGIK